jgi:hypothetical protein
MALTISQTGGLLAHWILAKKIAGAGSALSSAADRFETPLADGWPAAGHRAAHVGGHRPGLFRQGGSVWS